MLKSLIFAFMVLATFMLIASCSKPTKQSDIQQKPVQAKASSASKITPP